MKSEADLRIWKLTATFLKRLHEFGCPYRAAGSAQLAEQQLYHPARQRSLLPTSGVAQALGRLLSLLQRKSSDGLPHFAFSHLFPPTIWLQISRS